MGRASRGKWARRAARIRGFAAIGKTKRADELRLHLEIDGQRPGRAARLQRAAAKVG